MLSLQPSKYLSTGRLILDALSESDDVFFTDLIGNKRVRAFLGGIVPENDRQNRFLAYLKGSRNVGIWAVRLRQPRTVIGLIVLNPYHNSDHFEISYQFEPSFWGQGYAIEAVRCVLTHASNDLKLDPILSETQSANHASCSLLKRIGMVEKTRLHRFGAEQIVFTTKTRTQAITN